MSQLISPEVREKVIDQVKNHGVPVNQLAQEHGLHRRTIYGWLAKSANQSLTMAETNRLKRENQQLLEVVGKLTLELEKSKSKLGVRFKRGS